MRRWSSTQARFTLRKRSVAGPSITGFAARRDKSATTRQSVAELLELSPQADAPESVELRAFIRSIRKQKKKAFAAVDDGSSLRPLQAVLEPEQAQRSAPSPLGSPAHQLTEHRVVSQQALR